MSVGDAKSQRPVEIGETESSDAIHGIRRDVRRVDGADRDRHPQAAGKGRPAGHAVTGGAIAELGEICPASNQRWTGLGSNKICLSRRSIGQIRDSHNAQQAANASNSNRRNGGSPSHAGTKGPGDLR